MTDLEHSAARFLGSSKRRWDNLVDIVLALSPKQLRPSSDRLAKLSNEDPKAMWQKFRAILFWREIGKPADLIRRAGQHTVLRDYAKNKRNGTWGPMVVLSWKVSPELREAVHQEVLRIAEDISLRTSEEFWTWLLAEMRQWTKLELRHSAGEIWRHENIKT